jgi:hypothetical protein
MPPEFHSEMDGGDMMGSVLNCGSGWWLMVASGVAIYGLLALAGAALVKYLFFAGRGQATA